MPYYNVQPWLEADAYSTASDTDDENEPESTYHAEEYAEEYVPIRRLLRKARRRSSRGLYLALTICFFSILLNVILIFRGGVDNNRNKASNDDTPRPKFLDYDHRSTVSIPLSRENRSIHDPIWDSPTLKSSDGLVALGDAEASHMSLPTAVARSVDDSRGLYILQGYHSLHCLQTLRRGFMAVQRGQALPVPENWSTYEYCLNMLLEDTICHADDFIRPAGVASKEAGGQMRVCRDWTQLADFAQQHRICRPPISGGGVLDGEREQEQAVGSQARLQGDTDLCHWEV